MTAVAPLVDAVVGGVQKGGTTALHGALARHPAVRMPSVKEPHFFDDDARFAAGTPDYAPYHALWRVDLATGLACDATPAYLWWPGAAERVRDYNPAMRWIVLLRDPAERAYSHWNMERRRGREPLGFREALEAEDARLASSSPLERRYHSYRARGYYARQLERLFALFAREQVLVLRSDRLRDDYAATVAETCDFLGLARFRAIDPRVAHEGAYESPMEPDLRARLVAAYDDDVRALERLLGWDLAAWRR